MTVTTSNIYTADSKHILWKMLKDEFDALETAYPDKISVRVSKVYPITIQQIDRVAVVTIARVSAPEEIRFMGDLIESTLNDAYTSALRNKGLLHSDYYEVAVWTQNSDYRDQLYLIVKQIMLEKKKWLHQQGFVKILRVSGGDEEIDIGELPRVIYRAKNIYLITSLIQSTSTSDLVSQLDITQTTLTALTDTSWQESAQENTTVP